MTNIPTRPQQISRPVLWTCRLFLKLMGWRIVDNTGDITKCVIIGVHTSNWDGIIGIPALFALNKPFRWMGKDSLFKGWKGYFVTKLGGIPIDRQNHSNVVDQCIHLLGENVHFNLVIAPEGTRRRVDHWRSGFYHIATGAEVPIVLGYFDYARKECGFGKVFQPSGDMQADIAIIRQYYVDITPKNPENQGEIRFAPDAQ
jgi:1-acyl-sn-glycerol-3-phosphate acyltransferase